MGRSSWQKKTSFAILNIFKTKKAQGDQEDAWDDSLKAYKVFPSDQDGVRWVAEPGIDKRASAYINSITDRWSHLDVAD
ncbi:hypothetical protein L6452_01771 [Arctium lappa]|uniref:Uncharacterized protein n=1 Tax=Arctium lappa TaxID=4217 RepID=A0ACB9FI07_ARCLA|nr:hypothetical protein L6452_01771 [Arctium lappa]